jgi:hypothetical protein
MSETEKGGRKKAEYYHNAPIIGKLQQCNRGKKS